MATRRFVSLEICVARRLCAAHNTHIEQRRSRRDTVTDNTFAFNMKRDLPIIAQAFMNGELQYQKNFSRMNSMPQCLYAGPCGLGVCIPEADRAWFDNDEQGQCADELFDQKVFKAPNAVQEQAFIDLQSFHDDMTRVNPVCSFTMHGATLEKRNEYFRDKLKKFARQFRVKISHILEPGA
jgi:hypothetical protein